MNAPMFFIIYLKITVEKKSTSADNLKVILKFLFAVCREFKLFKIYLITWLIFRIIVKLIKAVVFYIENVGKKC